MTKGRIQGTIRQVRRLRDEELRKGQRALKEAVDSRKRAQVHARNWEEYDWNARFYADDTDRASKLRAHADRAQQLAGVWWRGALRNEATAAEHLATARKAAAALARVERKAAPRTPPDLWILFTVCLRSWYQNQTRAI